MVTVKPIGQKRLLATAGRHALVTDRKLEDGGSDVGCTSGELLLAAIGSCASGSLRNYLEDSGFTSDMLEVDVALEPSVNDAERDAIAITVNAPADVIDGRLEAIETAAKSGRVVSRMVLGSRVIVRCQPTGGSSKPAIRSKASNHDPI